VPSSREPGPDAAQLTESAKDSGHYPGQFRVPSGVWNVLMTAGPNTNSTECNREKLVNASSDEALIKQLEAAIYSNEIWEKALEVVCKRIASGEVSDNMLLHVVLSLSKSTAVLSCTAERRRW
jgi:hypothetical protein